jgi:hypothetical protein
MTTFSIYCFLFAATTLYAVLLSRFPKLEPDLTFVEVIVGVWICLLAAYLDRLWNGPLTSEAYEARIWLAFKVGGTPIVIWQLYKIIRAWRLWLNRILSRIYGGNTRDATDRAEALADHTGAPPNDSD